TPGSLQINLLFTMYAEHASAISRCKTFISSKDKFVAHAPKALRGGAKRLATRLALAKLSLRYRQLQHQSIWWS
ncbi:hypothetical protein, partial [Rhizobium laguerreae]